MISQGVFNNIKDEIKLMSDKQLAELNFEIFVEAQERASEITKNEVESAIQSTIQSPITSVIAETTKPR